jgi:hypothetical protein
MRNTWNGTATTEDFLKICEYTHGILELGKKISRNKYTDNMFYESLRKITKVIGQRFNFFVSESIPHLKEVSSFYEAEKIFKSKGYMTMEHVVPVKHVLDLFYEVIKNDETSQEYEVIFFSQIITSKIALISFDEEGLLRRNGWSKIRPADAYDQCNIRLRRVEGPPNIRGPLLKAYQGEGIT